ncbi:T9SS type A sorting domain-containing protein [Flavobacterium sp. J372]|uniref:Ig-like domain-containing protein n=1 Tax=Flavobacterium sp. J372 TaxID=2898436 RepID=UPI002150E222|nr:T9SS type A sorting domain-containing protein [Flavobacterium sp. J372]MCR5861316.1 T9SS type A sorting domain-containing protein [Flavobacterium sp. J372]
MNQIYFVLQQALGLSAKKQTEDFTVTKSPGSSINASYVTALLAVMLFSCLGAYAQTSYYSKATATDFNDVNSWGTATDGTGTAPSAISNADNFIVANSAALTLTGNAAVRQLTVTSGSLAVASNTLTVGINAQKNSVLLINGGTLNVSGGTINIDGYLSYTSGNFSQSGGSIIIDPNNAGVAATSTTSTQYSLNITAANAVNWTGGSITILDPPASTGTSHYSFYYNTSATAEVSVNHTIKFGNGVSADAGGSTANFLIYNYVGSGKLNWGNFEVYGPSANNRKVRLFTYSNGIRGNVTVYDTAELDMNSITMYITGNVTINSGATWTASGTAYFAQASGTSFVVGTNPSTVTIAPGATVRNLATSPTANFSQVTVNNTSSAGVTFNGTSAISGQPAGSLSVGNTLTFVAGKITSSGSMPIVLGTSAPSTGTLTYTSGGFGTGTVFGRWFTAAGTGSAFTAGADVTTATSRYPFVNAANQNRSAWIERLSPASAGGVLAMTYNEAAGTSAINVADGAYTANLKSNDTWSASALAGTPLAATTFKVHIQAPGIFGLTPSAANVRVIQGNTFVGTHQAGTITPGGQRVGLTAAELTAAPFALALNSADLPVISLAGGDWNNPAIWSNGAVPNCNTSVNIQAGHTVTVNSTINEVKGITISTGATLVVASGDLTVGCTLYNNTLTNNGTLTVSGGSLYINGNLNNTATSTFAQLGGEIYIDGNNGVVAESVPSGTPLFNQLSTNISLSAGILTFIDPHIATTNTNGYTLFFSNGTPTVSTLTASLLHTTVFGDGVSSDAGGSTSGFYINNWASSAYLSFGNIAVNGNGGTNRNVTTVYQLTANGDVTVTSNSTLTAASLIIGGNLEVDGTFVNTTGTTAAVVASNTGTVLTFGPSLNAQTFVNNGTIANLATSPTANFAALSINNGNAQGVTLASPIRVSGTLTLTAGKINTDSDNMLTLGTATAAGTLTGGSATAYINGPFERTIANNNANTNYIHFPVGKTAYAPIWLAPATTSVAVMRAEAFDSNTGTANAAIMDLASNRRWEAPLVSGTVNNVNVRLGGTFVADNIPVMANAAAGQYNSTFGSTATFVAGPPTTIQSTTPAAAGDYTGFISYAKSNLCSGTPNPGNTIASATSICLGTSVSLSVENATDGSGVSYQWQSSANGVNFTDIDGATAATLTVTPAAPTYYQLKVTCSAGPAVGTSTSVFVQFTNNITASSGDTRCGAGIVNLGAAGSAGSTVKWYTAQTGGAAIATGDTYSPSVSATTDYYVAAEVTGAPSVGGKMTVATTDGGTTPSTYGLVFNSNGFKLNSVDVYLNSTTAGNVSMVLQNSSGVQLLAGTFAVPAGNATNPVQYSIPLNWEIPAGTGLRLLAISGPSMIREFTGTAFPYALGTVGTITSGYITGTSTTYYYFYNWNFNTVCSSPRVKVTATVNTPPALTLSTNTVTICNGATSAPVTITAGGTDYSNYSWTPASGVSGNAVTGWTFNPTVSGTYTLNASQSSGDLCTASATVAVTVNTVPTALTITNSGATSTCIGTVQSLTATGATIPGQAIVGTDVTLNASNTTNAAYPAPYGAYYENTKQQYLIRASELTALGMSAGSIINNITFDVTTLNASGLHKAYTISIGNTAQSAIATWETGLTTVFGPVDYQPVSGANTHVFSTNFTWNGTSNIIVQVCHTNDTTGAGTNFTNNALSKYTTTAFNSSLVYRVDDANACAGTTITYTQAKRPNMVFGLTKPESVTWSPATNLYTDAAATTAYVSGSNANMVYVKPAAAGAILYTATAGTTCPVTATVTISAVDCAIGWGNLQWPPSATINTCGTETVYGKVWKENITEAAGANPNMKAWVGISTTNTDPATWTEAQWNAAQYNVQVDNDDEYKYTISGLAAGTYYYAFRYQYLTGAYWYGAYNAGGGGAWNGTSNVNGMLTVNAVALPTASNQTVCAGATVANLVASGTGLKWYNVQINGTALASTDVVTAGTYYVSQTIDGCESARVAVVVTISSFDAPVAAVTQPTCSVATGTITVTSLGTGYTYSINGTDFQSELEFANVAPGTYTLTAKNSIGCTASASVTVNAQPVAPVVDDPANVTVCGSYTLPALTVGSYFTAPNAGGTMLMAGDVITTNQTIYVFAESAGCSDEESFTVMVNQSPDLGTVSDVTACGSYTLPVRTVGNYYTAPNGGGTMMAAGTVISANQTIYVYAESGTTPNCTAEESFDVTITTAPAQPTGAITQTVTVADPADATIEDLEATAAEGVLSWYASEADALAGIDPLSPGTQLTNGNTYYATAASGTCYSTTALAVTVSVALGRDDFSFINLKYYPNPVTDKLTISHSSAITSVEVYNLLGQLVISQRPGTATVDVNMAQLQEATYIVRISAEGKSKDFKVVRK